MKKKPIIVLFLLTVFLSLSAPFLQTAHPGRKNIQITLQEKRISELSSAGLTISFISQITNLTEKDYSLVSYQYQVTIAGKEYFKQQVSLEQPIDIPAEKAVTINFPVKISYQYLNPWLVEGQKQASCQVSGEIFFWDEKKKTEKLSFSYLMDFPIFKLPELTFLPLAVKNLTLGGADFFFRFQVKNVNPYDLLIQKVALELRLGDRLIYNGDVAGDKMLEAGQSRIFTLPLILDFFEQGRELRDLLEQEAVPFSLRISFQADSAWGWLSFGVDRQGSVSKEFSR